MKKLLLEQFLNLCRKYCFVSFGFALSRSLIGSKKVLAAFSTNKKLKKNKSCLARTRFAAIDVA